MEDSGIMVVGIFLAAIIMFIYPLMTIADIKDDISALTVQVATTEFTNNIRKTGKITYDDYESFYVTLAGTGNAYNVEITVQILDENEATSQTNSTQQTGENVYYTLYTTQIEQQLLSAASSNSLILKDGDIVSVSVKNTSTTIAVQLRNFMYKVTGNDSSTITASASGMVTTTGK